MGIHTPWWILSLPGSISKCSFCGSNNKVNFNHFYLYPSPASHYLIVYPSATGLLHPLLQICLNKHLGNGEANWCQTMGAMLGVQAHIYGPYIMYYWKYGQRSMDTKRKGIPSNTPLHDTWISGSREIGWGVIHVEIVWSDLGMMCNWVMFSELVNKIFVSRMPTKSE